MISMLLYITKKKKKYHPVSCCHVESDLITCDCLRPSSPVSIFGFSGCRAQIFWGKYLIVLFWQIMRLRFDLRYNFSLEFNVECIYSVWWSRVRKYWDSDAVLITLPPNTMTMNLKCVFRCIEESNINKYHKVFVRLNNQMNNNTTQEQHLSTAPTAMNAIRLLGPKV